MSKKDDLRKQRENTVINNISKKQEKQLAKAIARVVDALNIGYTQLPFDKR